MTITIASIGHMNLTKGSHPLVRDALRTLLAPYMADHGSVIGLSCLARGADTLFAETVAELNGCLVVVLPAHDYRDRKVKPDHGPTFDSLVGHASEVVTMDFAESTREAYEAANHELLRRADRLFAVRDGSPASGQGSTGDTVLTAVERGIPVDVVWPAGASRG